MKHIGNLGKQDSEYDNSLSEWGLGDVPRRRVSWWKVVGAALLLAPWSVIAYAAWRALK